MQPAFESLRTFKFAESTVHLWVFKRSSTAHRFTARYAETDSAINAMVVDVVKSEMARITEFSGYTHLAQTNESSCLATSIQGCDFEQLKDLVDRPEPDWRVRTIKDLTNASGYVAKFTHNNQVVYAVKKSSASWKTSYKKTHINIVFRNGTLSAVQDDGFAIEKSFDFYAHQEAIFIASKGAFESAMEHRASYADAFAKLQLSQEFSDLFTDIQPLVKHVGTNAIQLRRMARIEERALFARPEFLAAVQEVSGRRSWGLNFDVATGAIIPCEKTVKTIIQILLDHRLLSEVTDMIYDVPDATEI